MNRGYLAFYLCFCTLIAVAVWMLAYSLILQIVWKDGRILHLMTTTNPLAPFQQFLAYANSRSLQIVAVASLVPAIAAGIATAAFGLRRPNNPLGDAAFQDTASLRQGHWFRKDGLVLGRFGTRTLRRNDDRHHLIIGPTRSGKGVGYVIPNALTFPGSMIITDLKGEVFELTAGYRKAKGHQVFLFSPGAKNTHRWNPLDFVRTDRGSRTIDIQNMAAILIPETIGSDNSVWQGTAQQVIAGVISYVLESATNANQRNFGAVNAFFNSGIDLQVVMKEIIEKEPDLSRFTTESFNAYISLNERAARSALLDIQKALAPFRNERVVAATAVTDMNLASLQRRPVTVYLAPNITDMTILRPLLTLFVQQVMDLLTRKHDPKALPVFFLLDEFRQLKKMDEILNKLPYVAGYNIKLAFVIQDLKNLDEIYGETSRHSLLANCGLQLILGANDQATADYASRALGKRTIRYQSESRTLELFGLPRRTRVEQIRERDLLMPQEIRQMPEDRMVLLVEGQRPIFARKLRYYTREPYKSAVDQRLYPGFDIPEVELSSIPLRLATAQLDVEPDEVEAETIMIPAASPAPSRSVAKALRTRPSIAKAHAEERISRSAQRLKSAVSASLSKSPDMPARSRQAIEEILARTVPDPLEVGIEQSTVSL